MRNDGLFSVVLRRLAGVAALLVLPLLVAPEASAYTAGNIVVAKVTNSSATGAQAATITLIEMDKTGNVIGTPIVAPTSGASALTIKISATTEGILTLSPDGKYVSIAGYRADVGTVNPGTSLVINRAIGRLDVTSGVLDTSTDFLAFRGDSVRGAATVNGTDYWISGAAALAQADGGVRYLPSSAYGTSNATVTAVNNGATGNPNGRGVAIFENQLYTSSSATNPGSGVWKVGTGLPTTDAQTYAAVESGQAAQIFFFADLSPTNGYNGGVNDTLYLSSTTGLYKYSYDQGTDAWAAVGSPVALTTTLLDIGGGVTDPGTVAIFGSSSTANDTLYSLIDSSGYNQPITATWNALANAPLAGTTSQYRGIVLLTIPEPTNVALLLLGVATLTRRARRSRS